MTYEDVIRIAEYRSHWVGRKRATFKQAKRTVKAFVDALAEALDHDGRISVPGFGVFFTKRRKARVVRDLTSGELIQLPAMESIGFRAAKRRKRNVKEKQ